MKFGVLGTGRVGTTIATKLELLGHEVKIGSRSAEGENAIACAETSRARAGAGTFAEAAAFGEVVFNCTAGEACLDALGMAGAQNLDNKVLIDVANPLDRSGMPPALTISNTDSLGEQIQRTFPGTRVVKTLNTVNHEVMVAPGMVPGEHNIFVSGNDPEAKSQVVDLLGSFGWPRDRVIDLGDITTSRGPEMYLALWLRLLIAGNYDSHFNIAVIKAT